MTGYAHYTRTNIETSDPRAVVVLLYEGIINFLKQALEALERGDRMEMSVRINKALKIIHFLSGSLDYEQGAEIAENLGNLYDYMRDTLLQANINATAEPMREVMELTKPLLEAWREVAADPEAAACLQARKTETPEAPAQAAAAPPENRPVVSVAHAAPATATSTSSATPPIRRPDATAAAAAGRAAYGIH